MRSGVCGSLLLLGDAALVFSLDGFVALVLVVGYVANTDGRVPAI